MAIDEVEHCELTHQHPGFAEKVNSQIAGGR